MWSLNSVPAVLPITTLMKRCSGCSIRHTRMHWSRAALLEL